MHLCMGAYGEHSSGLRNFEGFKLVTNLKETKEAKCNFSLLDWNNQALPIHLQASEKKKLTDK